MRPKPQPARRAGPSATRIVFAVLATLSFIVLLYWVINAPTEENGNPPLTGTNPSQEEEADTDTDADIPPPPSTPPPTSPLKPTSSIPRPTSSIPKPTSSIPPQKPTEKPLSPTPTQRAVDPTPTQKPTHPLSAPPTPPPPINEPLNQKNCTWSTPNGAKYDLWPIHSNSVTIDGKTYIWDFCETLEERQCPPNSRVCEIDTKKKTTFSLGGTSSIWEEFEAARPEMGVQIHFPGGSAEGCPENVTRSTTIRLMCREKETVPTVREERCHYLIVYDTLDACPITLNDLPILTKTPPPTKPPKVTSPSVSTSPPPKSKKPKPSPDGPPPAKESPTILQFGNKSCQFTPEGTNYLYDLWVIRSHHNGERNRVVDSQGMAYYWNLCLTIKEANLHTDFPELCPPHSQVCQLTTDGHTVDCGGPPSKWSPSKDGNDKGVMLTLSNGKEGCVNDRGEGTNRTTVIHVQCIFDSQKRPLTTEPTITEPVSCHYEITYANPAACPKIANDKVDLLLSDDPTLTGKN